MIFCIFYYKIKQKYFLIENTLNLKTNKIKILTQNIQRLPYYFRKNVNIDNIMKKYDILCLQENFCSIIENNKKCFNYNCIIPNGSLFKVIDSGLSVYSKIKLKFIDFIRFNDLISVDKFCDKGFLVFKIYDIYR